MDEHAHRFIATRRDMAREDAAKMRRAVAEQDVWQWDLAKLVRRDTEDELLTMALDADIERAASRAVGYMTDAMTTSGSTDLFDRAIREAKAQAAREVVERLSAAGLTADVLGNMLLGNRR